MLLQERYIGIIIRKLSYKNVYSLIQNLDLNLIQTHVFSYVSIVCNIMRNISFIVYITKCRLRILYTLFCVQTQMSMLYMSSSVLHVINFGSLYIVLFLVNAAFSVQNNF